MNSSQIIFTLLTIGALGMFAFTMRNIFRQLSLTKPIHRFDKIGERTLITLLVAFGQSKMVKKPVAGILHAIVWWGFLVITIGTVEMIIDGITGSERVLSLLGGIYDAITISAEIFAALIIISCVIFLIRRYIILPKRFSGIEMKPTSRLDATFILTMILVLMVSLLGMNLGYMEHHNRTSETVVGTYPISHFLTIFAKGFSLNNLKHLENINWWIHILLVLIFLNILPYSKHFHVIMAVPNVFFLRLEPFAKLNNMEAVTKEVKLMLNPDTTYAPPTDAATAPQRFGVKDVEDVNWKNLLDSYTCTECGRCTDVCPANNTGKLLSPRKLFIDLRKRMADKSSGLLKDKNFTDNKSLVGDYISTEELWACTTCMACIEECPVDIDHVPFIIDMRRSLVMEESKVSPELATMFSNIENNGAPWPFSPSDRMRWAENLNHS